MRIPTIKGVIKRRLLVNFRLDPEIVRRILPAPFRPKLHNSHAIAGICLIRLEKMRPSGLPAPLGFSSENAAHRFAVEWVDSGGIIREGVFIPRRDTDSLFNRIAGGRIFPGEHQPARFQIAESGGRIEFAMESLDSKVSVKVVGEEAGSLPASSCFSSLEEASSFFEGGSLGYSLTRQTQRFDGLLLRTVDWKVRALAVSEVQSSYFSDSSVFQSGAAQFDHALIMRNILHEWHGADDLYSLKQKQAAP